MTRPRGFRVWLMAAAIIGCLLVAAACVRLGLRRVSSDERRTVARAPVEGVGAGALRLAPSTGGARRILLDASTLARLRDSARRQSEAFRYVRARADEAVEKVLDSGYQGFEWADAIANLGLAWHATGDERYAAAGLRYLDALLDDRLKVGDKQGGEAVVRYDSGYGIRTFGAYVAIGYDWFHEAPGFDASRREKIVTRLGQWLDWYRTDGYLRDQPIANYYWGYLTALSFAGLATAGEAPAGDAWLELARKELATRALPALRDELAGGGWPEGYQYGEYTTMEIALVAEAFRTGAGLDITRKLPWLGATMAHHAHALLPDRRSVYDGGTWGEHPAQPSALGVSAVNVALAAIGDPRAEEGRWLTAHALPPLRREQAWVGLLAERAGAPVRDPRDPARLSHHLTGLGLTFARSDWSEGATWLSFQAGAWVAEDHQDADQGHFELVRGSDALLVDAGDSEGSATINHNTLLIDDGGHHMDYPPNQGVWGGDRVKTTRYGDDGVTVSLVGDIGEAYAPSCVRDGCKTRSVERLTRSLVFVRPGVLVVDDLVLLERPDTGVVWAAHLTKEPTIKGDTASAVIGASRVDIRTLVPAGAPRAARHEPTPSGEGSHRANKVWGPLFRLEVASAKGAREREFLHVITAGGANARPFDVSPVAGERARGARVASESQTVVVLLATADGAVSAPLGGNADVVVVAGLRPGRRYRVGIDPGCTLRVVPSSESSAVTVGDGGFVRTTAPACLEP